MGDPQPITLRVACLTTLFGEWSGDLHKADLSSLGENVNITGSDSEGSHNEDAAGSDNKQG